MKSAKAYRALLRERGVFYTPPELAEKMKAYLPEGVAEVYDPACGAGGLLMAFDDGVTKYGQDVDADAIREAGENIPNFIGYAGDTLADPAFIWRSFPAIVANPPYSLKWDPAPDPRWEGPPALAPKRAADWAFLLHCLYMLSEDGTAVTLNSVGVLFRAGAEGKIRKWCIEQNYVDAVEEIDGGTFEDTNVSTCIVVLKKRRDRTDITMRHNGNERAVPLEEVRSRDWCLTPRQYGVDPAEAAPEAPPFDEVNERCMEAEVDALVSMLETQRLLDMADGTDNAGKLLRMVLEAIRKWEEEYADKDAGREAD